MATAPPRPPSRNLPPLPTTPLRPSSSRTSLRAASASASRTGHDGNDGTDTHASTAHSSSSLVASPSPLAHLEGSFAELADATADLEANFMHLQLLHESLARFTENFAAFLYGLHVNAYCVDFPEAPGPESWVRHAQGVVGKINGTGTGTGTGGGNTTGANRAAADGASDESQALEQWLREIELMPSDSDLDTATPRPGRRTFDPDATITASEASAGGRTPSTSTRTPQRSARGLAGRRGQGASRISRGTATRRTTTTSRFR